MSMIGEYREIPPEVLERLKADPALTDAVIFADLGAAMQLSGAEALLRSLPPAEREAMEAHFEQATPEERARFEAEWARAAEAMQEALAAGLQRQAVEALEGVRDATPEQLARLDEREPGWRETLEAASRGETRAQPRPRVPPVAGLGERISVEKAWHGLHYLLCGSAEPAEGPLASTVLGGVEIGEDAGYGPARYLEPDQVRRTAAALRHVSEAELRGRYDPPAMESASVYPGRWAEEGNLEWLIEAFEKVRTFYERVAGRGNAVLLYLV